MYCPQCRAEYRPGFDKCADCGLALVHELPVDPEPEFVDFVELMVTYNVADMAFIKSVLDAEEITYFVKGEHFANVLAWSMPQRLMIARDQMEEAETLLKDVKLTFISATRDREEEKPG